MRTLRNFPRNFMKEEPLPTANGGDSYARVFYCASKPISFPCPRFAISKSHASPRTDLIIRNITISGTYDTSAKLCIPPHGCKKTNLQVGTHGLVFDKRYWDATIDPSEYSYVEAAVTAGYSILTYDRLGTGLSEKPDAYMVVQAPLELDILRGLTEMARSGELLQHAKSANQSAHSTTNLGDTSVASWGLTYARESDPALFGDRRSGYMVEGTVSALQFGFFSSQTNTTSGIGGFDPKVLDPAFSIRQTITTSEVVSGSALNLGPSPNYKGPVQFMLAQYDHLVCDDDCNGAYNATLVNGIFPKAKDVDFFIQNGTGHALTLHRKANLGYKATFDWLNKNGR
ncbi:hypothetical protein BU16DRAFT_553326 [Lophium mytilinum]|uniref:AB hydrolase-1 domain-containing protein n=1 Tax=Lophium mytilinum TaxID=390894 RepID=A0A6A6Q9F2_9PEZI|nr:hypothetical protein BU16DRAFT_553326 [Lophium mytilinum]